MRHSLFLLLLSAPLLLGGTVVSETSSTPYPGLTIVERVESGPPNRIQVAFVDLCASGVEVTARSAQSSKITPGSWGSAVGAELAVNGDFFRSGSTPIVYGLAAGFGSAWPSSQTVVGYPNEWYSNKYGWIAFGPDYVEFSHTGRVKSNPPFPLEFGWKPATFDATMPGDVEALVSGFPELVTEGVTYTCSSPTASSCFPDRSDMRDRHPRTAMGLTADRGTFILAVVDGRNNGVSNGMYGTELAALMADLGAWQAFNLDGGGSSAMWLSGSGYLNDPSDGSARSVANVWGVHATGSGAAASCFTPGGCYAAALPGAASEPFGDLPPGAPSKDAAESLLAAGITQGCKTSPRRYFCPNCGITREQMVVFLVKAAGIDVSNPPATATFDDVPTDRWSFAYVEAAAANGITTGCGGGGFCPQSIVNRGQAAAFVRRTLGWPRLNPATATFGDVPTDHTFYRDVETIADRCVTSGCGDGADYCPAEDLTRGQAAIFVARAFDLDDANPCWDPGDPWPPGDDDDSTPGDDDDSGAGDDDDSGADDDDSATGDDDDATLGRPDPSDPSPPENAGCACGGGADAAAALLLLLPVGWAGRRSRGLD